MTGPGPHEREMLALRTRNAASCIEVLRDRGTVTLTELSTATGLSRPTVESILGDLASTGLVTDRTGAAPQGAGRPARRYSFAADAGYAVGVDLGVNTVSAIASDLAGSIVASLDWSISPDLDGVGRLRLVPRIIDELRARAAIREDRLSTVVVAVTGIVDDRGRMTLSNLVPEWTGVDLRAQIERTVPCRVGIENDVKMAALAEHHAGAARFADDVVFVKVGRYISTAIILGGKLHQGRNFAAGEVGDLEVTGWEQPLGPDGERAGAGVDRQAMFERAEAGDPEAEAFLSTYIQRIAQGIALVGLTIDPELIVIGGGVSEAGDALLSRLRRRFVELAQRTTLPGMVSSTLGGRGVVLGALVRALTLASGTVYGNPDIAAPELSVTKAAPGRTIEPLREQVNRLTGRIDASAPDGATDAAAAVDETRREVAPLRIAIVGLGMRSSIGDWVDRPGTGARLVAGVDVDAAARDRAASTFGPALLLLDDHRALNTADIDAAIVVTPDDTHADIAVDLLEAGIAVYLDKPVAVTAADADRVLETARRTGTKLYVGHNMRHMAVIRSMRDLIARGDIGEVKAIWCRHFVGNGGDYYFKDWHAERARSNGLLLQKGAHDLDVIHWLAGSYTKEVVGMGGLTVYGDIADRRERAGELMSDWFSMKNWPPHAQTGLHPTIDVEDISMALLRLESGVFASYEQCHYTPDYWRNYTVIGTEGRLENFGDGDGGVVRVWNRRTGYSPLGDASYPIIGDGDGHGEADALTVQEFIDFVRSGSPTATSPVGARFAVAAAAAATESLRDGSRPRSVAPISPDLERYFRENQSRT